MEYGRTPRTEVGIPRPPSDELSKALLGEDSRLDRSADPLFRVFPGPGLPLGGADRLLEL